MIESLKAGKKPPSKIGSSKDEGVSISNLKIEYSKEEIKSKEMNYLDLNVWDFSSQGRKFLFKEVCKSQFFFVYFSRTLFLSPSIIFF